MPFRARLASSEDDQIRADIRKAQLSRHRGATFAQQRFEDISQATAIDARQVVVLALVVQFIDDAGFADGGVQYQVSLAQLREGAVHAGQTATRLIDQGAINLFGRHVLIGVAVEQF